MSQRQLVCLVLWLPNEPCQADEGIWEAENRLTPLALWLMAHRSSLIAVFLAHRYYRRIQSFRPLLIFEGRVKRWVESRGVLS